MGPGALGGAAAVQRTHFQSDEGQLFAVQSSVQTNTTYLGHALPGLCTVLCFQPILGEKT